jgi:hypothetical protein
MTDVHDYRLKMLITVCVMLSVLALFYFINADLRPEDVEACAAACGTRGVHEVTGSHCLCESP